MIIDTIENLGKYVALNPLFADVVEFLKTHDLQAMEPGKYPIKDKDLFLNLAQTTQRTKETAVLETHIKISTSRFPSPVRRHSATRRCQTFLTSSTMLRRTSRNTVIQMLRPM